MFEEKNGAVVIEAENFSSTSAGSGNASGNNWQKFTDINASNSEGVRAVPNNGVWTGLNTNGPRLDYKVRFQTAGTYRVYIRTQGPTNQDDSYHIGLNGTSVSTTNGYGMGWTGSWGWADFANEDEFVEVLVPSTGEHTFNIWMREDGVEIDKIVMKIQAGVPSGQGPAASAQVECSTPSNLPITIRASLLRKVVEMGRSTGAISLRNSKTPMCSKDPSMELLMSRSNMMRSSWINSSIPIPILRSGSLEWVQSFIAYESKTRMALRGKLVEAY